MGPTPDQVRRGLRRLHLRVWRRGLIAVLLLAAGIGCVVHDARSQPEAPPGGRVIEGTVVSHRLAGEGSVLEVRTGQGTEVVFFRPGQHPGGAVEDHVTIAVGADHVGTDVLVEGVLWAAIGWILIAVAILVGFGALAHTLRVLRIGAQLRSHPLVPSDARVAVGHPRRRWWLWGLALRAAVEVAGTYGVMSGTNPVRVHRRVFLTDARTAPGPFLVPSGTPKPLVAWAASGQLVPLYPPARWHRP